jgi:hypothetical protein
LHLYIWIAILLLFLGTVVAAYFASRVWHWAHVTLVVLVFMAAVGYFVLAAETLRINAIVRSDANAQQRQLDEVTAKLDVLRDGSRDRSVLNQLTRDEVLIPEDATEVPSLADLEHELQLSTWIRGKVWRNAVPAGFDAQAGAMLVTVELPQPLGIEVNSILFLFEEGEPAVPDATRGPQYLGEFRVIQVTGPQVALQSIQPLDEFERRRLAATRGPLALYETMPVDRYELFAGLTEEQLRDWLPEQSVQEYLRQGGQIEPGDDPFRRARIDEQGNLVVGDDADPTAQERYQRRLRDYDVELGLLIRRRVVMLADAAAVMKDNERLAAALASAKELKAFREDQKRKLEFDLAGVTKERQLIEQHLAAVEQQLANARQLLADAIAANTRLAEQLASLQEQWKQLIDERSSAAPADGPLAFSAP